MKAGLLKRLAGLAKRNPDVAGNVGVGSALAGAFGTVYGGPAGGLAYGTADFALSYPATLAARHLGTKITKPVNILGKTIKPQDIRGGMEAGANLAASLGSPLLVDPFLMRTQQVQPTNVSQQQQLMEQMEQRAVVNRLQVPQAVAPGTQFQMQGLESTFLRNYVKPQSYVNQLMPEYAETLAVMQNPLG